MIKILRSTESGLVEIKEVVSGCWINAVNPTAQEIEYLQKLGRNDDFVLYPLDLDERARVEKENDEILIIVRIPHYNGESADIPYITIPLGIIMRPNMVVTVCRLDNNLVSEVAGGRIRGFSTAKQNRFVLHFLLSTAAKYLSYLKEINRHVDTLEDCLQRSIENRELMTLLKYQKSLVYFTTGLKSNELMMERLQRSQLFKAYPDDQDLLDDVLTENQQAIEMVNIDGSILSQMMDAFASIISNNLNVVMKFLASITIVLSFPSMVASFYGMNILLPFAGNAWAIWIVLIISVLLSLGAVLLLRRRNWL